MNKTCLRTAALAVTVGVALPLPPWARKKEKIVLGLPDLVQFNAALCTVAGD